MVKWSLKQLPYMRIHAAPVASGFASISIPILVQGVTEHMRPLFLGFFASSVLIAWGLWIPSRNLSIFTVNYLFSFTDRRSSPNQDISQTRQKELMFWRTQIGWGIHAIIFCILGASLSIILERVSIYYLREHLAKIRSDIYRDLYMSGPDEITGVPQFELGSSIAVRNNSPDEDVEITELRCKFNSFLTTNHQSFDNFWLTVPVEELTLRHGGDGDAAECPPPSAIRSREPTTLICGDVIWRISYVLVNQPEFLQEKQERFILRVGMHKWESIPLDYPLVGGCPQEK
jgi:hypothetical protein